jgi:type VI secretion system secreted protein VgrG
VIHSAKAVVVNGAGSYTRWDASGITHGTSGQWTVHAATKAMTGAKSRALVMPDMPKSIPLQNAMALLLHYPDLTGVAGAPYRVVFDSGEVRQGKLDKHGKATLKNVPMGYSQVYYGETTDVRAPLASEFGSAPTDTQVQQDLAKVGIAATTPQDIDAFLAAQTGRAE